VAFADDQLITNGCVCVVHCVLQPRLGSSHVPSGAEQHLIISAQLSDIQFMDVQSGFGYVFTAQFRASPASAPVQVVLKVPKHCEKQWDAKAFGEELNVMCAVMHENLVRFLGVWVRPDEAPVAQTGAAYAVVTEYVASGTLSARVACSGSFRVPAVTRVDMLWQLASAMVHLHGAGVVHRDVKPDNVLVTDRWEVKLCDFGLSRFGRAAPSQSSASSSSGGSTSHSNSLQQSVHLDATEAYGTASYAAPEQFDRALSGSNGLTSAVDVYAFGGVMYFLLTAAAPWSHELKAAAQAEAEAVAARVHARSAAAGGSGSSGNSAHDSKAATKQSALIRQWVLQGRRPALSADVTRDNPQYVRLMERCWQQMPAARPSMREVQSALQALHALLCAAPSGASVQMPVASQMAPVGGASLPLPLPLPLSVACDVASSSSAASHAHYCSGSGFAAGSGFVAVDSDSADTKLSLSRSALRPIGAPAQLSAADSEASGAGVSEPALPPFAAAAASASASLHETDADSDGFPAFSNARLTLPSVVTAGAQYSAGAVSTSPALAYASPAVSAPASFAVASASPPTSTSASASAVLRRC
jgi:serine/threonine protein kinase